MKRKKNEIDWDMVDTQARFLGEVGHLRARLADARLVAALLGVILVILGCAGVNQVARISALEGQLKAQSESLSEESKRADHWKKRAAFWKAADKASAKMAYDCAHDHPKWGKSNP